MKNLAIDIKDGYAVVASARDEKRSFVRIDLQNVNLSSPGSTTLFEVTRGDMADLYDQVEEITLAVPVRISLVKSISIDRAAVAELDNEYLQWEGQQQIPGETGRFISGFRKLGESFDDRLVKFLYYAAPRDLVEALLSFVKAPSGKSPVLQSEAAGLLRALNLAAHEHGFAAAISLEHDGATVVLAHDGDFLGSRFISGQTRNFGDEVYYYVLGNAPENVRPRILLCGDVSRTAPIHQILSSSETLDIPDNFLAESSADSRAAYVMVAGLLAGP